MCRLLPSLAVRRQTIGPSRHPDIQGDALVSTLCSSYGQSCLQVSLYLIGYVGNL
ncbi:hypothetical protein REC12_03670 [Desulfosporosinus sp. PR]|nr:hypothetical protein [Desulfosporosinus sp. PR]